MPEGSSAWPNIINHLLKRVRQARAGEITLDLGEIADQLHGRRLQSVAAPFFSALHTARLLGRGKD